MGNVFDSWDEDDERAEARRKTREPVRAEKAVTPRSKKERDQSGRFTRRARTAENDESGREL